MKLIFIIFDGTKTEMSYVSNDKFNKLLSNRFIAANGGWIQHPQLWPAFFHFLEMEKNNGR